MRDQRHAAGQQLGPGGRHHDFRHFRRMRAGAARIGTAVADRERDRKIRSPHRPVLQLGLRDRGAEGDVPQRWPLGQVSLTTGEVTQEAALGHRTGPLVDGPVLGGPVDRQPESPPGFLIRPLVQRGQLLAQGHEVAPRHRYLVGRGDLPAMRAGGRLELRVVGE